MRRYLIELAKAEKERNAKLYYSGVCSGSIGEAANKRIEKALAFNGTGRMTDHEAAEIIITAYNNVVERMNNAAVQYRYYIEKYYNGLISADDLKKAVDYYNGGHADTLTGRCIMEYLGMKPAGDIDKAAFVDTVLWAE